MKERGIAFSKNYEEFYPKNYQRKNNTKREKEENNSSKNKNKNVTFKEYFPKNRAKNQQMHPLEKSTKGFYPKQKSKTKFEKDKKNEENFENSPSARFWNASRTPTWNAPTRSSTPRATLTNASRNWPTRWRSRRNPTNSRNSSKKTSRSSLGI